MSIQYTNNKTLFFLEEDENDEKLMDTAQENVPDPNTTPMDEVLGNNNETSDNSSDIEDETKNDEETQSTTDNENVMDDTTLSNEEEKTESENTNDDNEDDDNDEDVDLSNIEDDTKEDSYEKAYFASPEKYEDGIDLNRPLFVSPLKGISSLFVLPRSYNERKKLFGAHGNYNIHYDEWNLPESQLQAPLSTCHVTIQGNDDIVPRTVVCKGYIHTINMDKYKANKFARREGWEMDKEFVLKNIDHVDFENVEEIEITAYIKGEPR